jgi:hypothetical protein
MADHSNLNSHKEVSAEASFFLLNSKNKELKMKKMMILVPAMTLALTACEMPDIAGLNSMPQKTSEMSEKMDKTNEGIHKQTLAGALTQMDSADNQAFTYPIPTGIMAGAEIFAEEARPDELMKFMHLRLSELREVEPTFGMDKDGYAVDPTPEQAAIIRLKKNARLAGLQAVAAFTQDAKVDLIIQSEIQNHGEFEDTAYEFLALRAYFLRDILLKMDLKLDADSAFKDMNLDNSGKMKSAIKYLTKLDKISKLKLRNLIQVDIKDEANPDFIKFSEIQNDEGRKKTAEMWQLALDKSKAGMQTFKTTSEDTTKPQDPAGDQAELNAQAAAMATMQTYIDSWKALLP